MMHAQDYRKLEPAFCYTFADLSMHRSAMADYMRNHNVYSRYLTMPHVSAKDIFTEKNQLEIVRGRTSSIQLNTQFLKMIEKADASPHVEVQTLCNALIKRLHDTQIPFGMAQAIRVSLLKQIKLSADTKTLTSEQEKLFNPKQQLLFLKNEQELENLRFARALLQKSIDHFEGIARPITSELYAAKMKHGTQTPNAEHLPALEEQEAKLNHLIAACDVREKVLIPEMAELQKALDEKNARIRELGHWYRLFSGTELAQCQTDAHDLQKRLAASKGELSKLRATSVRCKAVLAELMPVLSFARKCHEELSQIHSISKKFAENPLMKAEDKAMFEAIANTLSGKPVAGEIAYELTHEGKELLVVSGVDTETFQAFVGNAVQKNLIQKLYGVINRAGKTLAEERSGILRSYTQATVHSCAMTHEMIRYGTPYQAFAWSKLSTALERARNVAMNMARGIARGVTSKYDLMTEMSLNPESMVQELRGVAHDFMAIIRGDKNLVHALKNACIAFGHLPASQQAVHAMTMLTTFMMPGPNKLRNIACFNKTLKSINELMHDEVEALNHFEKLVSKDKIIIKGAAVPVYLAEAVNELVLAGRLTTAQEIGRWVEFVHAPLTSTWKEVTASIAKRAIALRAPQNTDSMVPATVEHTTQVEVKPEHAAQIETKLVYAGQAEYEAYVERNSFQSRTFDPLLQKALEQTRAEGGFAGAAYCPLDHKAIATLEKLGFDAKKEFENQYAGNYVQHHIHRKFIASLNKIGGISLVNPEVQKLLRGAVVLNKAGQEYNNQHRIKQALSAHQACDMVIDYAKTVADLGLAVGEGAFEALRSNIFLLGEVGKGALDVLTFPEEIVPRVKEAFHKATLAVSRFVAVAREDLALMAKNDTASLQEFVQQRNERGKQFEAFSQALSKKYHDTPLREQVKIVAQLFTECKSLGVFAELFVESVALKRVAASGAIFENMVLSPEHALAEEVIHIAAHTIDVEPIAVKAVLEMAQQDVTLLEQIKKSQDALGKQITAYFDKSLDVYKASPGFVGVDRQKPITQIAGLSLPAVRELRLAEYLDESVGDIKKLQEAIKVFVENSSAICDDGPLTRLLKCGSYSSGIGALNTARGAAYELERGYLLFLRGEKSIVFGIKLPLKRPNSNIIENVFDVDIETTSRIVECKNLNWSMMNPEVLKSNIQDIQSSLPELQKLARSLNKDFEFHSRHAIPDLLKKWLIKREITFFEG